MLKENTCPECGEFKREDYELCYTCHQYILEESGNLCDCGNYKSEEYKTCYECNMKEKNNRMILS